MKKWLISLILILFLIVVLLLVFIRPYDEHTTNRIERGICIGFVQYGYEQDDSACSWQYETQEIWKTNCSNGTKDSGCIRRIIDERRVEYCELNNIPSEKCQLEIGRRQLLCMLDDDSRICKGYKIFLEGMIID